MLRNILIILAVIALLLWLCGVGGYALGGIAIAAVVVLVLMLVGARGQ